MADELKIVVTTDANQFEAALGNAGAAADNFSKKVASDNEAMNTSWQRNNASVSQGLLGFHALGEQLAESSRTMAGLRSEILTTTDATHRLALESQLAEESAKYTAARTEMRAFRYEMNSTTETAHLFSRVIGIDIPTGLMRMLGQFPQVRAAMGAAFEVGLVMAVAAAVVELTGKIMESASAWIGWGKAEQDAFSRAISDSNKARDAAVEAGLRTREQQAEQLPALAAIDAKQKNINANQKEYGTLLADAQQRVNNYTKQIKELEEKVALMPRALPKIEDGKVQLEVPPLLKEGLLGKIAQHASGAQAEYNNQLANTRRLLSEAEGDLRKYADKAGLAARTDTAATLALERKKLLGEEGIKYAEAQNEVEKGIGAAKLTYQKELNDELYAIGVLSARKLAKAEEDQENQSFEQEKRFLQKKKDIAAAKGGLPGAASTADEQARIQGQIETLAQDHQTRLAKIQFKSAEEQRRQAETAALDDVAIAKKVSDQKISIAEEAPKRLRAAGAIDAEEEKNQLIKQSFERQAAEEKSLRDTIAIKEKGGEKTKEEVRKLYAELLSLARKYEADRLAIEFKGATDSVKDLEKITSEVTRANDQKLRFEQTFNSERLRSSRESLGQWLANEQAAIEQWYNSNRSALDREMANARQNHLQNSDDYRRMIERMNELDRQHVLLVQGANVRVEQSYRQMYGRITQEAATGIGAMITGQQKWAQVVMGWEQQVLQSFLNMLAKKFAAWLTHLTMERLSHQAAVTAEMAQSTGFFSKILVLLGLQTAHHAAAETTKTGITTAASSIRVITETAADIEIATVHGASVTAMIAQDAIASAAAMADRAMRILGLIGLAGAGGVASMAAAPFPIDLTAPAFGAAMAASAAAFGTVGLMQEGGIVPGMGGGDTFPAMLAPREMVLPRDISVGLQGMIASGSTTSTVQHAGVSISYSPTVTGTNPEQLSDILDGHSRTIVRIVKDAMREGTLPSYE